MTQPALTTTRAGMPMDEFIRRYETEGPFELVEGEIVGMSPTIFGHGRIAKRLLMAISAHVSSSNLGEAFMEMPFVVTDPDNPAWVKGSRIPEVAYFQNERLKAYEAAHPDSEEKPLALVPDLVAEVVSRHDSYSDIGVKVENYLADGVRLVWVVDPWRRRVTVHERGSSQQTTFAKEDTLTGGKILPGFEIRVGAIFGE